MMTKQNNRQIQSILYLTFLFSTLILTTGCFGEPRSNIVNTRGHRTTGMGYPNPGQSGQPNPYSVVTNGHGDWSIEYDVETFIGEILVGSVTDITTSFSNNTVSIYIYDEDITQQPFTATLHLDPQRYPGVISYSDDAGTVYFEVTEEPQYSQISFENIDGTSGILGYIDTCRVEGTC